MEFLWLSVLGVFILFLILEKKVKNHEERLDNYFDAIKILISRLDGFEFEKDAKSGVLGVIELVFDDETSTVATKVAPKKTASVKVKKEKTNAKKK